MTVPRLPTQASQPRARRSIHWACMAAAGRRLVPEGVDAIEPYCQWCLRTGRFFSRLALNRGFGRQYHQFGTMVSAAPPLPGSQPNDYMDGSSGSVCMRTRVARPELVAAIAAPDLIPDGDGARNARRRPVLVETPEGIPLEVRLAPAGRAAPACRRRPAGVAVVSDALRIVLQLEGVTCR